MPSYCRNYLRSTSTMSLSSTEMRTITYTDINLLTRSSSQAKHECIKFIVISALLGLFSCSEEPWWPSKQEQFTITWTEEIPTFIFALKSYKDLVRVLMELLLHMLELEHFFTMYFSPQTVIHMPAQAWAFSFLSSLPYLPMQLQFYLWPIC